MENNPFSLIGKTILVTGASSGIGRAVAIACSKMGATVIATGRNSDRLEETFKALEGEGHVKVIADLASQNQRDALIGQIPSLDGLVLSKKKINKEASIVFLSSRTAEVPTIANALYSASKGAIQSYAKSLSLELAPRQIRVNCICPAMVWTPLVLGEGVTEEELREQEALYPLKRYGRPEDIANLAVFLLSSASSWMTGTSIDITGGAIGV